MRPLTHFQLPHSPQAYVAHGCTCTTTHFTTVNGRARPYSSTISFLPRTCLSIPYHGYTGKELFARANDNSWISQLDSHGTYPTPQSSQPLSATTSQSVLCTVRQIHRENGPPEQLPASLAALFPTPTHTHQSPGSSSQSG